MALSIVHRPAGVEPVCFIKYLKTESGLGSAVPWDLLDTQHDSSLLRVDNRSKIVTTVLQVLLLRSVHSQILTTVLLQVPLLRRA